MPKQFSTTYEGRTICVAFWRTGKQAKLTTILLFSFRMNAIQEDFFSKLLIFLTVWCSCWSKVSRNEPPETDFSEVRIRHHKHRSQNMTHNQQHHQNGTNNKTYKGYVHVTETTVKDIKYSTIVEPTTNTFDNFTELLPLDGAYGYNWPEPGTAFPW